MAIVIPFKGILYNTGKVKGGEVVCPPYDIITPEMRESLYAKNPYNIVRIDAGKEQDGDNDTENKYSRAKAFFDSWLKEGILVQGAKPAFYIYEMEYSVRAKKFTLTGFFGLVRIEELGNGVYPHEATHSKPKHDRLSLLSVCHANTSPIFSLYDSKTLAESGVIEKSRIGSPYIEAIDTDGNIHRVWTVDDESAIKEISDDLEGKAVFIADGHHRYETALEFKKMQGNSSGNEPFDYVLMFLANIAAPGLTILPTHRLINVPCDILDRLSDYFSIDEIPANSDILDSISGKTRTFGMYVNKRLYTASYTGEGIEDIDPILRGLDVVILHQMVFDRLLNVTNVAYEMDVELAKARVDSKEFSSAFFLNPTSVNDVESVALSSLRMPPKSTYFYPKVMTGFVINSFNKI